MSVNGDNIPNNAAQEDDEEEAERPRQYAATELDPMVIMRSLADSQKILTKMLEGNPNIRQGGENFNGPKA